MARRITPVAVDQPAGGQGLAAHSLAFEGPLDVGPAPDQGDVRAVHPELGAGRRVWVDIQSNWQVKFKQVLRQQGLDYKAWEHEQKEKYEEHFRKLFGEDEKRKDRPNIIANILKRNHEMMRQDDSDEEGESLNSEDDSEEEGDGDDDEGGDDASSDDGEAGGAGDEIDLDKEEDKSKKPKRQRCERYEDDFIDDSEIERVKGGPKVKTLYSGFFINKGQIQVVEEPTKQRRRAPKPAAAEAAAAAGDGSGSGPAPPTKRRKQQEQQQKQLGQQEQPKQKQKQKEGGQQQQQQQQEAPQAAKKRKKPNQGEPAAAAAGEGSKLSDAGGRKKRGRGDATEAAAEGDRAASAPANKRARKASPATSDAAAAAAPPPSQLPPVAGSSGGKQGTAAAALAAAVAAASKRAPAASSTPAAALPPAGPSTARKDAAAAAAGAEAGTAEQAGTQQQRRQNSQDPQHQQEHPGKAAAAVCAVFPGGSQPEAAASGGGGAAAAGDGDEEGVPAGLSEDVVAAALALQKVVQENDAAVNGPTANAASRKVITAPLSALGLAFASLSEAQQAQQEAQLLALVRPMLPHMTDKALRKKVLQEPRDKLGALQQHREALLAALGDVKGVPGGGDGSASDDDFQQAWSTAAEDNLVAAWTAAKAAGGQASLEHLAVDVCAALGNTAVQGQPAKAVAELQQVFRRAQKRHKEAKAAEAAAKAAAAAAGDDTAAAGPEDAAAADPPAAAAAEAAAPAQAPPAAAAAAGEAKGAAAPKRTGSRQLSPAPSGAAAVAAAAAMPAGTPVGKQQPQGGSQDSDGGGEDGAAGEAGTQAAKAEFSRWSAPSPRLERCVAAAKAAGASEEWLSEKYTSIQKRSTLGHQAFRILCCAGPAGCEVKDFPAVAEQHSLECQLDDSAAGRRSLRQAIGTVTLSSIVGVTEVDANKVALLVFPGVVSRPTKPARAATPLQGGQPDGEGAADAAAAE